MNSHYQLYSLYSAAEFRFLIYCFTNSHYFSSNFRVTLKNLWCNQILDPINRNVFKSFSPKSSNPTKILSCVEWKKLLNVEGVCGSTAQKNVNNSLLLMQQVRNWIFVKREISRLTHGNIFKSSQKKLSASFDKKWLIILTAFTWVVIIFTSLRLRIKSQKKVEEKYKFFEKVWKYVRVFCIFSFLKLIIFFKNFNF